MSEQGKVLEFSPRKSEDPKVETKDSLEVLEIVQFLDPNEAPKVLARCELVRGTVQIEGDENLMRELREEEFYWDGKKVTPEDGEKFLRAVKASYHNPYLLARKIK